MRALTTLVLLMAVAVPSAATTRILFSNYAPDSGPVMLQVDGTPATESIGYPETDNQYRLTESGDLQLAVVDADGSVLVNRTVSLTAGDYSVFFYRQPDGMPAIEVARDALAAFDFPAPPEFETNDGNAAFRFLSFATFPVEGPLAAVGTATQQFILADGSTTEGGEFRDVAALSASGGAAMFGAFPANVNSRVSNDIVVEAGVAEAGSEELSEVLVREEFVLPAGTTDYVIVGDADSLQVIERPRPGNRSELINGLYGEPGINGSGLQLYELREIGRVYGLLYTYREDGTSVWYYLDSRCDLDRGFQCTTPGLVVAGGSYLVAVYEATNGMLAPGVDADLQAVGTARVRVDRTQAAFIADEAPATASVFLSLEPPIPGVLSEPDVIFAFQQIAR